MFLHEKDRGPQGQQLGEVGQQAGDVDAGDVNLLEGSRVRLDAPLVEPVGGDAREMEVQARRDASREGISTEVRCAPQMPPHA